MADEQNVPTQQVQQHNIGDEVVYTDNTGTKHAGILEHTFSHAGKLLAHLKLKHNDIRFQNVEHDAHGSPHSWHAKKAGA